MEKDKKVNFEEMNLLALESYNTLEKQWNNYIIQENKLYDLIDEEKEVYIPPPESGESIIWGKLLTKI